MKKITFLILITTIFISMLTACGANAEKSISDPDAEGISSAEAEGISSAEAEDISSAEDGGNVYVGGIAFAERLKLDFAEGFDVYYSEDGYKLIEVYDSAEYLIVPEGESVPEGLDEDVVVIKEPTENIYLAASSAMALIVRLGALDKIGFSGTKIGDWYVDEAAQAMEAGDILFAGKYSQPDYELLVNEGCSLAVESTMILHTPEVREKLIDLGIPVLIDRSSYESHPLGRVEWIKLYGALTGCEDEAESFFEEQEDMISGLDGINASGKTVAFFYVNSNGQIVVRRPGDYIPEMIEMAGGEYIFDEIESADPESNSGSVTISMEEFYASARDADYLIYNATIESPIFSVEELVSKDALFSDFKAVKDGNVYMTDKYMYQATDILGEFILDINGMLSGADELTFLTHVE